ncbi:hypothetical protein [Streptomyces coeruleorubidus]
MVLVLKDVRKFSVVPVAAIDDPVLPEVLAELAAVRADEIDADTVDRELSIARKAIGWWQRQGWIECDPTIGTEHQGTRTTNEHRLQQPPAPGPPAPHPRPAPALPSRRGLPESDDIRFRPGAASRPAGS